MRLTVACVALLSALVASCAEGSSISDLSGAGGGQGGGLGRGGSGGEGGDEGPATTSSRASSSAGPATSSATSSSSGGGEGGGDATSSSSSSSTGTGQTCNFTSPNACANAESLGFVAGDEDGLPVSITGATSKWFTVRIEETSSSISDADLSYSVSLTSPAGMNYDVIVHEGPQDGDPDCGAAPTQGTPQAGAEVVSASWDDDQGFGGEDDSLWLMIEVRWISGEACSVADQWTLVVEGNI